MMTTGILANWRDTKEFAATAINQRNSEDNTCITEGLDFATKTREFKVDRHNPTGSFFPHASHAWSLGQDVVYILAFPLHKVATTLGKGGFTLWEGGLACKTAFLDKTETFSEAAKPAFEKLKNFGIDALIVAIPLLLRHRQTTVLGLGVYNSIWWMATAGAIAYALYNPKGMKVHIAKAEDTLNVKPLDDYQVTTLERREWVFPVLDGSFSLSRILDMHRIGRSTDKCDDGKTKKFEYVDEEEKKSK